MTPIKQFTFAFEYWVAAVFGIYSEDFREWNEYCFRIPSDTQDMLTCRFWDDINEGWIFMQPQMIALQKENELWDSP